MTVLGHDPRGRYEVSDGYDSTRLEFADETPWKFYAKA